jgi:PAS domain S-box-containing protein
MRRGLRTQFLLWTLVALGLFAFVATSVLHLHRQEQASVGNARFVADVAEVKGLEAQFRAALTRREVCANALMASRDAARQSGLWDEFECHDQAINHLLDAMSASVGSSVLAESVEGLRAANRMWLAVLRDAQMVHAQQVELAGQIGNIERELDEMSQAFLDAVRAVQGHLRLEDALERRALTRLIESDADPEHVLARVKQALLGDAARLSSRVEDLEELLSAWGDTAQQMRREDDPQLLVSLRDNHLVPTLRQLQEMFTSVEASVDIAPGVMDRVEAARFYHLRLIESMLGRGWRNEPAQERIVMGEGGFYSFRSRELDLEPTIEALEAERVDAHVRVLRAVDELADDIGGYIASRAAENRAYMLQTTKVTLMIGGGIAVVFALLGGVVSLLIRRVELQDQATQQVLRLQGSALEHAANAVVITDRDGQIEWVNPAFTRLTGYEPAEAIGQNPKVLKSGRHAESFYREMWGSIAAGEVWHNELVNQRKDGTHYFEEMTIAPVRDERGRIDHFVAIKQDVTARVRAEKATQEAIEFQQKLIDTAATAVFVVDTERRITSVNEAFCNITGYAREEVLGQPCSILDDVCCATSGGLLSETPSTPLVQNQCKVRAKDGRELTVLKNANPYYDEEGRISGGIESFADVTELDAARREAEEANQAKSAFLANMSHELRTPLHGILSFAEFGLQKYKTATEEKLLSYFTKIKTSGETLLDLLNDLLDLAKLEVSKMRFEFRQARLDVQVAAVVDEFGAQLSQRSLAVTGLEDLAPLTLPIDAERVKQVVRNLLSNAIKFSSAGEAIEVGLDRSDDFAVLSVRDCGVGIPEGELESVFDKFVQSSKTRSGAGGTGLGLSICREIVAAHGGRIWAEHNPGGGSVFVVELPLKVAQHLEAGGNGSSKPAQASGTTCLNVELAGAGEERAPVG